MPTSQLTQEGDLDAVNNDLNSLIAGARSEFAADFLNPVVQQRLKALLDLQGILQRQQLTQDQLRLVRDQVSALGTSSKLPAVPNSQTITPSAPVVSTPLTTAALPAQSQAQTPLQNLLNPGMLAGLIKATANQQQQPIPPPQATNIVPSVPMNTGTPQPPAADNLLAALRARGLLPGASPAPGPPVPSAFPLIVPGQTQYAPPTSVPQSSSGTDVPINVQMNTASIKM